MKHAFTLIELLIVVAIIAILAAIAVPNFLEAQVRAKIARVKSDQRTVGIALECYGLDSNGKYPPGRAVAIPIRLTTPIAYLSAGAMTDPFLNAKFLQWQTGLWVWNSDWYQYANYPNSYSLAFGKTGPSWFVASVGPSKTRFLLWNIIDSAVVGDLPILYDGRMAIPAMCTGIYDPSNGTTSLGAIVRAGGNIYSGLMAFCNR